MVGTAPPLKSSFILVNPVGMLPVGVEPLITVGIVPEQMVWVPVMVFDNNGV